ncbi:SAM-dependent methyltransferase, partial [Streptomyces sp. UH6]|nr:SAM-dependent methyltransferase [Streptomyces sp. UH6]
GGVLPDTLRAAVSPLASEVTVEDLTGDPDLWGRRVDDVRYALVARMR